MMTTGLSVWKKRLPIILLIAGILVVAGLLIIYVLKASGAAAPTKTVITSEYEKSAKATLDGRATDEVWSKVEAATIPTEQSPPAKAKGPAVTVKSFYNDTDIYFLFEWADSTENKISKVWEFNGQTWQQGLEQDKLAVLWDKSNSVAYFDIKGCGAVCHTEESDKDLWFMATNSRREKTDFWFWMAGISNIYGRADDRALDDTVDLEDPKAATRRADKGDRGFDKNGYKGAVEKIAPVRPTKKYLLGYNFESDPYPLASQMDDITSYKVFKAGDKVAYIYFYGPPTESRGDIRAKGIWKNGRWTLEMRRKLNTGNRDDMVFTPDFWRPVYYMYGLAVFNHTEPPPIEHYVSGPVSLKLAPKR